MRIGHLDFQLFAVLILAACGRTFISQKTEPAGLPDAQQAFRTAQPAAGGVEQRIGFEDPAFGYTESGGAQKTASGSSVRQRQLDLDFARRAGLRYSFLPTIA